MRIKITGSDPKGYNWSITDAETGEEIDGVRRVEVIADADGHDAHAFLYTANPEMDVTVEAELLPEQRELATCIADEVERRLHDKLAHYLEVLDRVAKREAERGGCF